MYNADIKERFILDCYHYSKTAISCKTFFDALEPFEKAWGADICTRTAEEIEPVIRNTIGIRSNSASMRRGIILAYYRWCCENNIPGARDDVTLATLNTTVDSNKMKTRTVVSPKQFAEYLDAVFDPVSEGNMDIVLRCYYWLGFGGATLEQAINTTVAQTSLEDMSVTYSYPSGFQKTIPIYREAIQAFRSCLESTSFKEDRTSSGKGILIRDRIKTDKLLRGVRSNANIKTIRAMTTHRARTAFIEGRTDHRLSFGDAWLSGVCFRLYMQEAFEPEVDFSSTALEMIKNVDAVRGIQSDDDASIVRSPRFYKIRADLKRDYSNWKKTLGKT